MFIFSNSPCQVNCEVLILAERSGAGRTGLKQTLAVFDKAVFHHWAIEICGVVGVVGVKLSHHWVREEYLSRGALNGWVLRSAPLEYGTVLV